MVAVPAVNGVISPEVEFIEATAEPPLDHVPPVTVEPREVVVLVTQIF
jgi:hypothetical protein